jgi:hypothetical protein
MAAALIVVGAIGYLFAGFVGAAMAIVLAAAAFLLLNLAGGILDGLATRGWASPKDSGIVMCALCEEPHLASWKCAGRPTRKPPQCALCNGFHDNTMDCGTKNHYG